MASDPQDPLALFHAWFAEARASEPDVPEAMSLATSTPDGRPSMRMVLLKEADARGFVFYTNFESRKGGELLANANAALLFHWKSLARQVRVEGSVEVVSDAEADAYFASRPRDSRIGAWASAQSREMDGRFALEREVAKAGARYLVGEVPRPAYWSGFRIVPRHYEFWRHGNFRLHERLVFDREGASGNGGWRTAHLFP